MLLYDFDQGRWKGVTMSQFKFIKPVIQVFLGLCLVTGQVMGESINDPVEERSKLYLQWLDHFWADLETNESAPLRATVAARLIQTDDSQAQERGRKLLQDIFDAPKPDALSLWIIASACSWIETADFCVTDQAFEKLDRADPGNAAVLVMRFGQQYSAESEDRAVIHTYQDWLAQAAEADRFDSYWGRGAVEFFRHTSAYIDSNPPPLLVSQGIFPGNSSEPTAGQFALVVYMSTILYTSSFPYQSIDRFCRAQTNVQNHESMAACEKLASVMRNKGNTSITRAVGYGMSREMLRTIDPDHPGIASWVLRKQVFDIMMRCYLSPWQSNADIESEVGDDTIVNWLTNLEELGEWEGNRLSSRQEYEETSEHFLFDPKKCDRLQALDNEDIVTALDGQTVEEAWQKMKLDD